MVFVWKYLISPLGGVFGIYKLLPTFLFSLCLLYTSVLFYHSKVSKYSILRLHGRFSRFCGDFRAGTPHFLPLCQ